MVAEYYTCECFSPEHTLRFDLDEEDGTLWSSVHLSYGSRFHQRVWKAIKYVFGYKSKYGHFDCFDLQEEDIPRLKKLLERSERSRQRHKKSMSGKLLRLEDDYTDDFVVLSRN